MSSEVWSDDPETLEQALREPEGRVFRTRAGERVTDCSHPERHTDKYVAFSEREGWYYLPDGRLYTYTDSMYDIVSVLVPDGIAVNAPIVPPEEQAPNVDFLRLVSYALNEEAKQTIEKSYTKFRLLETGHLRELGFTGKRKQVSWENARTLLGLLDIDRLFDSLPWLFAEGDDIHEVFEQHRPGSCMRDSCKHELRQLYALNPDKVKVAYQAKGSNGFLQSSISCLVWYGKDTVYIDRRYCEGYLGGTKEPLIRSLARQIQRDTGKTVKLVWKDDGIRGIDTIDKPVQFTLNRDNDLMPWCDSIKYVVDYDDDTVTLSTSSGSGDNRLCCQDQSGQDITEHGKCKCCSCGTRVDEDDVTTYDGQEYCESCYSYQFSYCSWSEQDYPSDSVSERRVFGYSSPWALRYANSYRAGNAYHTAQPETPDWHDMMISDDTLRRNFTSVENGDGDGYCLDSLVIQDNRNRELAPDYDNGDFVVLDNGEIYHPDDVCQIQNGETHPIEDCTELEDGTYCLTSELIDIDGQLYYDDGSDNAIPAIVSEVKEPEQEVKATPTIPDDTAKPLGHDWPLPPNYRYAVPGDILPEGSLFAENIGYGIPDAWCMSGECGRAYGETSFMLLRQYIVPVSAHYASRNSIRVSSIRLETQASLPPGVPEGYRMLNVGETIPQGTLYAREGIPVSPSGRIGRTVTENFAGRYFAPINSSVPQEVG